MTACIQNSLRIGADPVAVYQLMCIAELVTGFGKMQDFIEDLHFLEYCMLTQVFLPEQNQKITGGKLEHGRLF